MKKQFLAAEWRKLAMVNYAVDRDILAPYLPAKTEIDTWNGASYLSLVGFMFMNTKIKGFRIPFHTNFEEVNLRFYVKFHDGYEWKRGVVFIKEIVPKPALTFVANSIYRENYETMRMDHEWITRSDSITVTYKWKKRNWSSFSVKSDPVGIEIIAGSEEEFITEHYWGYTRIDEDTTSEYQVEHPRWKTYHVKQYSVDVNFGEVYGEAFDFLSRETPKSVFLADGSEIIVREGRKI